MSEVDKLVTAGFIYRRARGKETQSAFADRLGIDQTSLSRIEGDSQDPGFTKTQVDIGKVGVRLDFDLVQADPSRRPLPHLANNHAILRLMPESLRSTAHTASSPDGPTSSEAAYWMKRCQHLAARASEPEARLQSTYSSLTSYQEGSGVTQVWRYERDRDLVHVLGRCGRAAAFALHALYDALSHLRTPPPVRWNRKNRPTQARLDRLTWCRAVYAVALEGEICALAAKFCRDSVQVAFEHDRSLEGLAQSKSDLQLGLNGRDVYGDSFEHQAKVLKAEEAESQARERRDGFAHQGGNSRLEEVGNAGERMLAIELLALSDRAWALFDEMVDDVFMNWHQETGAKLPSRDR